MDFNLSRNESDMLSFIGHICMCKVGGLTLRAKCIFMSDLTLRDQYIHEIWIHVICRDVVISFLFIENIKLMSHFVFET